MYQKIALASSSPRRRELLTLLNVPFEQITADIDETPRPQEDASRYVLRLAEAKARAGAGRIDYRLPVLGADTIVVAQQQLLGKPQDYADFCRMMSLLSGNRHQVLTAVAIVTAQHCYRVTVQTEVFFRTLTAEDIEHYWLSGEPQDKAGGYGIQGNGGRFIERINGSYTAVVGLPLCETEQLLRRLQDKV